MNGPLPVAAAFVQDLEQHFAGRAGLGAALFLIATVPVTHGLGGRLLHGKVGWGGGRSAVLKGGSAFHVFQALSWSFFTLSLAATCASGAAAGLTLSHRPALSGSAVCGALLAEVLLIASLLTFQPGLAPKGDVQASPPHTYRRTQSAALSYDWGWDNSDEEGEEGGTGAPAALPSDATPAARSPQRPKAVAHRRFASASIGPVQHAAPLLPPPPLPPPPPLLGSAASSLIALLCLLLVLMGTGLVASVALNAVAAAAHRLVFMLIAAVSVTIAVPVTHGVGGALRHHDFRFFMPGRGGWLFVACQAIGWAVFSLSILSFAVACWLSAAALTGRGAPAALLADGEQLQLLLPSFFWVAGAGGVAAQVVLAASLLAFRSAPDPRAPPRRAEPLGRRLAAARDALAGQAITLSVLLMVYAPCHLLLAAVASLFLALEPRAAWAVLGGAAAAYGSTYVGHPGHTGARTWPAFQRYSEAVLAAALARWFGLVRVVAAAEHPAAGEGAPPLVFGYHPHGMYPAAAAWFHHLPQWRAAFPGRKLISMGASAIFHTPMLRDVVMWSGARTVSRKAVRIALIEERASIVLCPGGQAELCEHRSGSVTTLCTRHKGFLRFALETGAPVVPIFVFGEAHSQRNLLQVKGLQRWTAKRLGFPFPFLPGGYLRVLPLPEPKPLSFVVGPQIELPDRVLGAPATAEEVDALHARYYATLQELFEAHKVAAGYPDATLVLKHD